MLNIFGNIIGKVAKVFAKAGSTACVWFLVDEPQAPHSIVEK